MAAESCVSAFLQKKKGIPVWQEKHLKEPILQW